ELEHAHRELKKLDTAKTEFLNITSHELRSPLTSILGYAEILSEGLVGPVTDGQRESAYGILRNARQLERLINDLLDFTQMETGRLRLDTEVCDLKPIIKDAVESMRPRIEEAGCAVSIEVPPDLPPSICDARRITQVLYNLIGNAVKFSPDGGTITISANKVDRFIRISVKDEGVGIPEENQEKIFDKFYQVDMSDTRRARGLGLGLAISKAIIDAHGGSIWVDSKPEKGSTFYFTVPIEERRRS
ncbi:MAG TPA: HAMP domain-containing histidine kinase, partial [Firmicutes bacterium]|nr:HAMP domain-containing histidine kinase [Bacillota bacterium]